MAQRDRKAGVVTLGAAERPDLPRVGRVVGFAAGVVRVDFEGSSAGPVTARIAAGIDDASLEVAARDQQEAALIFEGGAPDRPIVLALLRSATPHLDAALSAPLPAGHRIARVDGRRVEIEGAEEVVLRCGKASLSLRRDGKVVLKGVNLVSQAEQVQKVRGGKVQIN